MQPEQVREIIKQLFSQYSPATIRDGSVIVDQIVNPLVLLGAPLYDQIQRLIQDNNYPFEGISGEILDRVGERLLSQRSNGSRCTSYIRVVVSEESDIQIRNGAGVSSSSGSTYRVLGEYFFKGDTLSSVEKWGKSLYETTLIPVESVLAGPEHSVASEALNTPEFTVSNLVGVYNPTESTVGTKRESNQEYRDRLLRSLGSRSLDTPNGINFTIPERFGSLVDLITIHGTGDPLMKRDEARIRRLMSYGSTDFELIVARDGSGVITDLISKINDVSDTLSSTGDYTIMSFNEQSLEWSEFSSDSAFSAKTLLGNIPYGDYVVFLMKHDSTIGLDLANQLISLLGSSHPVTNGNTAAVTDEDFLLIGRKGDPNFISREMLLDPADGNETINFSSLYVDQTGGSSSFGFQNKTRGSLYPNASKYFRRSSLEKLMSPILGKEILQTEYNELASPNFSFVRTGTGYLFEDDFSRTYDDEPISYSSGIGNGWIAGGTGQIKTKKDTSAGVFIYNEKLILGSSSVLSSTFDNSENRLIKSKDQLLVSWKTKEKNKDVYPDNYNKELFALIEQSKISESRKKSILWEVHDMFFDSEIEENILKKRDESETSPIIEREIEDPYGFSISGTFKTTDVTGETCAITMARRSPSVDSNLFRWYEGYGVCFQVSDEDNLPNLFVVDNSSGDRQMTVLGDELVNGKLNHNVLSQTRAGISRNTNYQFEAVFGGPTGEYSSPQAITLDFRIWKDGTSRPVSPTISYGSYIPSSRREIIPSSGTNDVESQNIANTNYIGIGVSRATLNNAWIFDNIKVQNVDPDYAQALVELDVRGASDIMDLNIVARGSGNRAGTRKYGHVVYLWNPVNESYVSIGDHDYSDMYFVSGRYKFSIAPYAKNGRVTILITSKYSHEGVPGVPIESILDVDFILGEDFRETVHLGGKADVLFRQIPVEGTHKNSVSSSFNIVSPEIFTELSPSDFGGPIEDITGVTITTTGGPIDLSPEEYRFFWEDESLRGTMNEKVFLAVDDAFEEVSMTVTADVYTSVYSIQSFFDSNDVRKVDGDLLAKHRQSYWIDVDAYAEGSWSAGNMSDFKTFIYQAEELSYISIVSYLQEHGLENISIIGSQALSCSIRYLSNEGSMISTPLVGSVQNDAPINIIPGEITIVTQS